MRIIAAVDILQESATEVVAQASQWAERLGATLDLVYVDEYENTAWAIGDVYGHVPVVVQWEEVREAQQNALDTLLATVPEACRGNALHRKGLARQTLVELCADYDAMLVATQGRTGIGHALLGSVAERVVRLASVPVLVLRLPTSEA